VAEANNIRAIWNIPSTSPITNIAWTGSSLGNNGTCATYPNPANQVQVGDTTLCLTTPLSVENLEPGDRLCMSLQVSPWKVVDNVQDNPKIAYSSPTCYLIAQKPNLKILGADSVSGTRYWNGSDLGTTGGAKTGIIGSFSNNPLRGSWSQYGLLVHSQTGTVTNFGSAGSTPYRNTAQTNYRTACGLWFANTTGAGTAANCNLNQTATTGGKLLAPNLQATRNLTLPSNAMATSAPSGWKTLPAANVSGGTDASNINLRNLPSGQYFRSGDLTITNGAILPGTHRTIVVNGTLTISDQLIVGRGTTYGDSNVTYTSLSEVPTLTLIANQIKINRDTSLVGGSPITSSGVSSMTLYGTLIQRSATSGQAIYTCTSTDLKKSGSCYQPLYLTGAIVARNSPRFTRTIGGGKTDPSVPAETINYTPNLWLTPWYLNSPNSQTPSNWVTTSESNLPARW
jgi:hypothetical protein